MSSATHTSRPAPGQLSEQRAWLIQQSAVLEERSRLARELHDSATQALVSLTMLAEGCRALAAAGELAQADQQFARIGAIAADALLELRVLIHQLRPPVLASKGLIGALQHRMETVEERFGVAALLTSAAELALPTDVEEHLYRIILEALNNTLKHARARAVAVEIRREAGGALAVTVRDDGCGFDAAAVRPGCGLRTMRERAERISGVLSISSSPGAGATLTVVVSQPGSTR